jgi:hypothetical protein
MESKSGLVPLCWGSRIGVLLPSAEKLELELQLYKFTCTTFAGGKPLNHVAEALL